MCWLWNPDASLPGNSPACSTHNADTNNAGRVLDPLARSLFDIGNGRQRTRPALATCNRLAPVTSRQANVAAVATSEQRRLNAFRGARRCLALAARVLHVVVDALRYEDEVGEAKVDCEGSNGGHKISPECAGEVGDVANEPDCEEGKRDAICRARLVVFYELGDLWGLVYAWMGMGNEGLVACAHGAQPRSEAWSHAVASTVQYIPIGRSTMPARWSRRRPKAPRGWSAAVHATWRQ